MECAAPDTRCSAITGMRDGRKKKQAALRAGVREETWQLFEKMLGLVAPPPALTLSEWADRYRYLSSEDSAEQGRWHTDRAAYQKEPMDAITDTRVRKVVLMWGSQMGKTTGAILNAIGYYIHNDPSPMMALNPTVEMGATFSKNRLSPMIRDTPVLREIMSQKSRDKNNTIQEKQFPGGYIAIQGANSPAALAARPIRLLFADEIDRYPLSAGMEGDPLLLAETRMTAFWNSKEVVTSTPTIKGLSKIEAEYEHSTQEVWTVPCPRCGKYQGLSWEKIVFDSEAFREGTDRTVKCRCESCGEVSGEQDWRAGFARGKYRAEYPRRKVRGFFVNSLSSSFTTWEKITEEFLQATDEAKNGNREPLKTWTNTKMAETWDEEGEQMGEDGLLERAEEYGAEVPAQVQYLTCAVDTQDDRFEYEVLGWGRGKESWGIEKGEIYGDLKKPGIWQQLDETLMRTFEREDGVELHLSATCIDSGGHFSLEVYRFCKERWGRNVWAIKGKGGMDVPFLNNPTKNNRARVELFTIGVDVGKVLVYERLKIEEPGPGYCHFPVGRGYDENYFKGLTAEKRIVTYKKGRATTAWVLKSKGFRRNEPLDLRNYNTAAMEIARLPLGDERAEKKERKRRRVRNMNLMREE